ncbi:MAG: T9SS type A sorting domain-containing protein [Cryomorphaceae bacterium]|nr:T9SS type A sorting domain-containing protein [Cryomorphaceae bacterium]
MKKILILAILVISSNLIFAQFNPKKCITTDLIKEELKNNIEYELMRQNLVNYQQENKGVIFQNQPIITIPVVVHIVHRTQDNIGANTNISIAQIEDQLRILNEDYSKTNPEFPNPPRNTFINYAGNPELKFCLASIDPSGNQTTGITRTPTSKTSWDVDSESNDMKQASLGGIDNWDPLRYLNIWVCNLSNSSGGGQTLGYAYLPGLQGSNSQSWKDGLVVDYMFFGTTGSVSSSSNGRTTTHEIGHYLGLNHTFCESTGCCDNDLNSQYSWGDVDDTPATEDIYFGSVNSNTTNNTCNDLSYSNVFSTNVLDMDENYMSYATDTWMFSQGQVDVMLGTLNASTFQGGRANLKNSTVTVNCGGIMSGSWNCDSQGNCNDPGTGNGIYSSYNDCLVACGCTGNNPPIIEGFQNGTLSNDWSIENPDVSQTWEINSNYGYNSTSSISIENSIYSANGEYDDLNSPIMNFSNSSNINLSFDYAYSLWTDPSLTQSWSDTLIVLISSDCGLNWQKIWEKAGTNLSTTNPVFNGFEWFPSSNNDWKSENINLSNYSNLDGVIIKFRNVNQYENNLFIDNINITSDASTNIDENNKNIIEVYPNPSDEYVNINYDGLKQIYTILGKKLFETNESIINISSLSKGVYVIKTGGMTMRFVKE